MGIRELTQLPVVQGGLVNSSEIGSLCRWMMLLFMFQTHKLHKMVHLNLKKKGITCNYVSHINLFADSQFILIITRPHSDLEERWSVTGIDIGINTGVQLTTPSY